MRLRAWLLLFGPPALFLGACSGGTHDVTWKVAFPAGSAPAGTTYVHAEIRDGACGTSGPRRAVFDVPIDVTAGPAHALPMDGVTLPKGTYCISAEARGATCQALATGSTTVMMPGAAEPIVVTIDTPASTTACAAAQCTNGYCSDAMLDDAGPPDMGMNMPDMPGVDSGPTCGGCTAGGTCLLGVSNTACGTGGAMCMGCGTGRECASGTCVPRVAHFGLSAVTSFLLQSDGHIRSSGSNTNMQRGNFTAATPFSFEVMTDTPGNGHAVAVAASQFTTFAIGDDGFLYSWGGHALGLLGRGGSADTASPGVVTSATWVAVTAGNQHACGIQTNGTLWCWGDQTNGRLGNGLSMGAANPPVPIMAPSTFVSVSAGNAHTCAVRSDHTMWCWGSNWKGQLGTGSTDTDMTGIHATPLQVGTDTDWTSVSASNGGDFTCGIRAPGSLWCWGDNMNGELGNGSTTAALTPAQADPGGPSTWKSVSAGQFHACGIRGTSLLCWGANNWGNLGDGSTTEAHAPQVIVGTWSTVTSSWNWTCGTKDDATSYCWGRNMGGVLGVAMDPGTVSNVSTPTAVSIP